MNSYGPEGANDYSPGCQPGVHMINRVNSEGVTEHHKSKTFKEELIEILGKHGVDYDPKYLWD
jgi:protein-tyrosine-phosphatase